jgi:hypothetical protein
MTDARPGARSLGGSFLAGARGRLLTASIPFRFFGAALVFHLLAWLAFAWASIDGPPIRGGLGWPLAALHMLTVGTLLMSAIGASLQLLPVATQQPVRSERAAAALWWVYVPGAALLTLGMGLARPGLLAAGAAAVIGALVVWAWLLAMNLRGARGMPGVVLHGWGALGALALLLASAAAMVSWWLGRPLVDHAGARALHLVAGVFGVMGLLALGLAYILLPMFALAPMPAERRQLACGAAALAGVALGAAAAFGIVPVALRLAALAAGAIALTLHKVLMRRTLATGMRRDFGRALVLIRCGWGALALALVLAAATVLAGALGGPEELLGRLFVLAAVGGWLLSFLLGVLQRIAPFLAAMHAARGQKRPPTPSALTLERPLGWHLRCHLAGLAGLAAATLADSAALAVAASLAGAAGAAAFAAFFAVLVHRLQAAAAFAPAGQPGRT